MVTTLKKILKKILTSMKGKTCEKVLAQKIAKMAKNH